MEPDPRREVTTRTQRVSALTLATATFAACFACWVINSVLVAHLVNSRVFDWSEAEVGWLLGLPFFTGAVSRVPLGILTDRYGGRVVFSLLFAWVAASLVALSFSTSFLTYAIASLGVGFAGGSFAVGVGFVSSWFDAKSQGSALGVFGSGMAGAALTSALAPPLLISLTRDGADPAGWRWLPRLYAVAMLIVAIVFVTVARTHPSQGPSQSIAQRLAPLRDIIVWRFGLYYLLVFGGVVAMGQWIVPYGLNAYGLSVGEAGLLAALLSVPSGLLRAAGGWLSDRIGAGPVMYGVFAASLVVFAVLAVPRMDIMSPGEGVLASVAGRVESVSADAVVVAGKRHAVQPPSDKSTSRYEPTLPQVTRWQVPAVSVDQTVSKRQLLATGVTHVHYPANLTVVMVLLVAFGAAAGIGMGGVLKFIPERFPSAVGVVAGTVGLIGALGGFVFPPLFGLVLRTTGMWSSCFWVLAALAAVCLVLLRVVTHRIVRNEAPDLVRLIEKAAATPLGGLLVGGPDETLEAVLARIPFLADLSREELAGLARIGHRRRVASGEVVFREGDTGDALYVVIRGSLEVSKLIDGSPKVLSRMKSAEHFGELALLDGGPRSATVMAMEACDLFTVPRADFLSLLGRSPRLTAHLLVGLSNRLRQRDHSRLEPNQAPGVK